MTTLKCPQCGLVNFASAAECKRCHLVFHEPERSEDVNRLKCPKCGLVNFASVSECKRCHARFAVPEPQAEEPAEPAADFSAALDQLAAELEAEGPAVLEVKAANERTGKLAPLPEYFDAEPAPYTAGMILCGITVGLGLVLLVFQVYEYSSFYNGEQWKALTNRTNRIYTPIVEYLFFSQWILKVLAVAASALIAFLFLRKSFAFLKWVRAYLIAGFIFILVDGLAGWQMEKVLRDRELGIAFEPFMDRLHWSLYLYGIAMLLTVVGFRYFTTSKRPGETFIN